MTSQNRFAVVLVAVHWAIGVPMLVLGGLYAVPRAFHADTVPTRIAWAVVPVLGLVIMIACIATFMRRAARVGGNIFERRWLARYNVEIFAATGIYAALSVLCVVLAPSVRSQVERVALAVAPMLGIALILAAIVRWISRADEFHKQRQFRSIALAAAITAVWTWSYGYFEVVGFPRLSMFWVWPVMVAAWGIANLTMAIVEK